MVSGPVGVTPSVPQDVMVVGEPSLMGGEFGDEDERLITRLENAQTELPAPPAPEESSFTSSPLTSGGSWTSGERPPPPPPPPPQTATPGAPEPPEKKSPAVGQ